MQEIYRAEDGKIFESSSECLKYEFSLNYPDIKNVKIISGIGRLLDPLADSTYMLAETVIVENDKQVEAIRTLGARRGYNCYMNIDKPGKWEYNDIPFDEKFILVEE